MQHLRRRISPATVLSFVAVVLALGGTATAASTLLNGSKIKKASIPGNRLKNNTVTGKQVKESTLGTVPSATNAANATNAGHAGSADNATNAGHAGTADNATHAGSADSATNASQLSGHSLVRFFYAPDAATAVTTTLVDAPGFTLSASCVGSNPQVILTSKVDNSAYEGSFLDHNLTIQDASPQNPHPLADNNFDNTDNVTLIDGSNYRWGDGHLVISAPNGAGAVIDYGVDFSPTLGSTGDTGHKACLVHGFAILT